MPRRRFEINRYGEIIDQSGQPDSQAARSEEESANWTLGPLSVLYNLLKEGWEEGVGCFLSHLAVAILAAPLFLPFVLFIGFIMATALGVILMALFVIVEVILWQFGIDISFIAQGLIGY